MEASLGAPSWKPQELAAPNSTLSTPPGATLESRSIPDHPFVESPSRPYRYDLVARPLLRPASSFREYTAMSRQSSSLGLPESHQMARPATLHPSSQEGLASSSSLTRPFPQGSSTTRAPLAMTVRHPGCVLCGIVAAAATPLPQPDLSPSTSPLASPNLSTGFLNPYAAPHNTSSRSERSVPTSTSTKNAIIDQNVIYQDEDITVYPATGKERLCDGGRHLIVVLNRHLESVYDFGAADVPLLSHILETSRSLLAEIPRNSFDVERGRSFDSQLSVGFAGTITRDPQSPHRHLHAHAMLGSPDPSLPGATFWRRNVVFGTMNWWSIEDLRAEIRESTSNNRVKSGYDDRPRAPIDRVPNAGSFSGLPNALDPDPYSHNVTAPTFLGKTQHTAIDSKEPGGGYKSMTGGTVHTESHSLAVPLQQAATLSEESLVGEGDGYIAVGLEDGSSRARFVG